MRTYENKDELKKEINKSFAKYIFEFNDIPESLRIRGLMKLIELRQKISLTKLDGQRSSLNGKQMKEKVFMSKLLQMILNGISLVNYINGSQIHMRICHCRS